MAQALDILIDQPFVSPMDDDEVKTTWMLRSLTALEFLRATQNGFVDHEVILSLGITGWKDFPDSDGNEIEYSKEKIALIPPAILQDISFEIQGMSTLSGEERKNLSSQSE